MGIVLRAARFAPVVVFAILGGCASKSSEVPAAYVSPLQYQSYDCKQLAEEATRISSRVQQVSGAQDGKRTSDVVATTVAVVVFWPALFAVKGDDHTTAELGRLKGEMEAVEKAAIAKRCSITFRKAPPEATPES